MADPFADVARADPETVAAMIEALEARAADPSMRAIVEGYLDRIDWPAVDLAVEVGSGTGAVARMMADRLSEGRVLGVEPSEALVAAARERAGGRRNLAFEIGKGTRLPVEPGGADLVVMNTLLSHVGDPEPFLDEAARVLGPGGTLAICDADFSKLSLRLEPGDPLGACAEFFVANFVTDAFITGHLREDVRRAGFAVQHFEVRARSIFEGPGAMAWVQMTGREMVRRGLIGDGLARALIAEYERREATGQLYGFLPFATLIATPD